MCPWRTRYKLQAVPRACAEDLALLCDAGSHCQSTIAALNPAGFTAGVAAACLHGQEKLSPYLLISQSSGHRHGRIRCLVLGDWGINLCLF